MSDYIKRADVLEAVKKDIMGGLNARGIIERFPAADVRENGKYRWIPCSERLPEIKDTGERGEEYEAIGGRLVCTQAYADYESDPVLVTGEYDDYFDTVEGVFAATYNEQVWKDGRKFAAWYSNAGMRHEIKVTAWMPLPEPYVAAGEDD